MNKKIWVKFRHVNFKNGTTKECYIELILDGRTINLPERKNTVNVDFAYTVAYEDDVNGSTLTIRWWTN